MVRFQLRALVALMVVLCALTAQAAVQKNILYFGNSFLLYYDAPSAVSRIAQAAGFPAPLSGGDVVQNTSLGNHINNVNANPAILNNPSLPPGGKWDAVVLQELSVLPTNAPVGNPTQFRADSVTLYNLAKGHSPSVTPVMMETWAKQPNSTAFYPSPFSSATQMQSQLRTNINLAAADINASAGLSLTKVARNGDAFESLGFASNLYDAFEPSTDIKHPSPRGTLLNALILYDTIFQVHSASIPWTSVSSWASDYWDPAHGHMGYSINSTDWAALTATADSFTSVPEPTIAFGLVALAPVALKRRGRAARPIVHTRSAIAWPAPPPPAGGHLAGQRPVRARSLVV